MKKLLLLLFAYLLLEGNNVIGDGLYVFHRGSHAVEQLKTKVDEYYSKVKAVDKKMADALAAPYSDFGADYTLDDTLEYSNSEPVYNPEPSIVYTSSTRPTIRR